MWPVYGSRKIGGEVNEEVTRGNARARENEADKERVAKGKQENRCACVC